MENIGILRKPSLYRESYKSESLLKSSPNILENFRYEKFNNRNIMSSMSKLTDRPASPKYSETIEKNLFMTKVIPSPKREKININKEISIRRSLEEISKDIKEIEDFITVTENIIKSEREQDRELYARERRRKLMDKQRQSAESITSNKENETPSKDEVPRQSSPPSSGRPSQRSPTYKINSFKTKRNKSGSPKYSNATLYFRDGKIGCIEAEQTTSNLEPTLEVVKNILKYENERPLVSHEHVQRVLRESEHADSFQAFESATSSKEEPENSKKSEEAELVPVEELAQCNLDDDETIEEVNLNYSEPAEVPNQENFQPPIEWEEHSDIPGSVPQDHENNHELEGLNTKGDEFVRDQVRHLVRRFTLRTSKMKTRLEMPPTPPSSAGSPSPPPPSTQSLPNIQIDAPEPKNINRQIFVADDQANRGLIDICPTSCCTGKNNDSLDPQGKIYISWLCIVSVTFLYNAWVIPLRSAFPFQTPENTTTWLAIDFCADIVYLLDVLLFKHRVIYLFEGFWVKDAQLTRKNYMRKLQFKLDLISLLPLDLLYLKFGVNAVYLRFPRLLKIQTFWEVFKLLDRVIASPHFVRVAKTLTYMLYMIHLTACSYYAYSAYQGLGTNRWVFSGKGHPYVRCFAFATKTATSIGKNPKPEKEGELVFMTSAWLMGVFVFALLIGQIRDIIGTATRNQSEYRQLEDETLEYMRRLNLPKETQTRIKMWFKFTWDQQRTLDESHILDALPANLKTDIALAVHIQTLSKVQLFADCEEALLRELVLKLRAVTFLPGDYVCRKGEVGKEMYIVKLGQIQVMGGPNNDEVLATLYEGSVFGEISLLAVNQVGGNRRTADVRSKGYANLFVLSKSDLNDAIVYYPNAQAILKRRARSLIQKNAEREREEARRAMKEADVVIANPTTPPTPPKLLKTVIEALPEKSPAVMLLTRGSKRIKKKKVENDQDIDENDHESTNENAKCEEGNIFTFENVNEKRPKSPDLLASIEDELKNQNKCINLTDSEKALIMSSSSTEDIVTVHLETQPIDEDQ